MANYRSGIHTKINSLIKRSGGYSKEYHINKLKEVSDMKDEYLLMIMRYEKDYDKQLILINKLNKGDIDISDIIQDIEIKKQNNDRKLERLLGTYGRMLRDNGIGNIYMDMLKQGF